MHIAGGLYRELCSTPAWNAVFGSGGRAAAAVSSLSPGSTLHTYLEDFESPSAISLRELGVELRLSQRPTPIVFAYFHPLSRPHIQPPPEEIARQPTIQVSGEVVLRFGFLEGDAVVNARRAIYDPQTWRNPAPFGANGSVAEELAIVLNEHELRSATGVSDLSSAASLLMKNQSAALIVAKGGIKGATVFERSGQVTHVPAYRSSRVFKIGTGDVFSAVFAHHWAERKLLGAEAADVASRSVAAYCCTGQLPLANNALRSQIPLKSGATGTVLIEGAVNTIGRRYTMEEARFVLRELGIDAVSSALDGASDTVAAAVLLISDGFDDEIVAHVQRAKSAGIPIVILRAGGKRGNDVPIDVDGVTVTDDFTSALYFSAWAAGEQT